MSRLHVILNTMEPQFYGPYGTSTGSTVQRKVSYTDSLQRRLDSHHYMLLNSLMPSLEPLPVAWSILHTLLRVWTAAAKQVGVKGACPTS